MMNEHSLDLEPREPIRITKKQKQEQNLEPISLVKLDLLGILGREEVRSVCSHVVTDEVVINMNSFNLVIE